jgi:hypothetical protein
LVLPHFLLQWLLHRKQARTEEFWPRSTVHRSFERFQAIDLSFGLAVASRLRDRISDSFDVSQQCARETLHAPESRGEPTHCTELRPVLFHCIDLCSLIGGQQPTGLDAERRRNNRESFSLRKRHA